jgi:hypothetical protein
VVVGLAIDKAVVDKAAKDLLIDALEAGIGDDPGEPHVIFLPVTVHGGANTTKSGSYWHIPKRDLVHAGIVTFQNRRLHVAKLRYRGVFEGVPMNVVLVRWQLGADGPFHPRTGASSDR